MSRKSLGLKLGVSILDVGPHFQISQCTIYQLRQHGTSGPSSLAEVAGARLAQVNGFCEPTNTRKYIHLTHSTVYPMQMDFNARLSK